MVIFYCQFFESDPPLENTKMLIFSNWFSTDSPIVSNLVHDRGVGFRPAERNLE